ncbi:MAG: dihydrofolate reductase family protein [Anaerolineae bacterium]|nr:dihydrofolate reductase family protein [Anaerolineae bacterium]
MSKVIYSASVSLDGFVALPNDEVGPLFDWYASGDTEYPLPGTNMVFKVSRVCAALFDENWTKIGASVTGRHTFDVAHAWGGNPPGGGNHFVVTHHVPPEWVYEGSPFTFVTDGIANAVGQAKNTAGTDKHIDVVGANIMQQCLKAGLLDEIHIDLIPLLLGEGIRLFDNLASEPAKLETIRVIEDTGVTHLQFRVVKE